MAGDAAHAGTTLLARRRDAGPASTSARPTSPPSSTPAAPPARRRAACSATTTTRPLTRQIGICWERTADDVVWTPLPLFHFNAIVTAVLGPLRVRRPGGDLPAVLGLELLAGDEPGRRHHHLDARHDGLPAGPRRRPARDAALGRARGQHHPAPARRGAAAGRGRRRHPRALRHRHLQRRLRRHRGQPRSRGSRRACATGPTPPASINDEYFDVRIFDDDDNELPRRHRRRDRHPPQAART